MQADNLISDRSLDQLESDLVHRAARMNAEEYVFLCDVREFDIRRGWEAYHFSNCAEWLNWKCQISPGAAREKVRVANQLYCLPLISGAFQTGALSYSKARALTRIADASNEKELLEYALDRTAFQVENHCRALRNGQPDVSTIDANQVHRARFLSRSLRNDGSMTLHVELPQETGELVMKAIEMAMAAQGATDHDPDAEPDSFYAQQADALLDIVTEYLAGGSDDGAEESPKQSRPRKTSDNYTVMVHVDESALAGQGGKSDLPLETVRRLTCDGSLLSVLKDKNGEPLNVGRKHRIVPTHIERALCARDRTCRFPGCTHTKFLQNHHIIHWADGGETRLSDMLRLCSRHHRLQHEGGYTIHKDYRGRWYFRNADGKVIPDAAIYRPGNDEFGYDADASREGRERDSSLSDTTCTEFTAHNHVSELRTAYG